jgi:exodeoxyribonuclease VII small subunit
MTEPSDDAATLGYAEALAELEGLLRELDDDRLDVDLLAAKVARANALVEACRARIAAARVSLETVVADPDDD